MIEITKDDFDSLMQLIDKLSNDRLLLLGCCKSAVKYLSHPDVISIPFVLSSGTAADRIKDIIDKVEE